MVSAAGEENPTAAFAGVSGFAGIDRLDCDVPGEVAERLKATVC
jgi:hypothetical protein